MLNFGGVPLKIEMSEDRTGPFEFSRTLHTHSQHFLMANLTKLLGMTHMLLEK